MAKRGRPTDYTPKIAEELLDYIDSKTSEKRLPYIYEFCRKHEPRIYRSAFYRWLEEKTGEKEDSAYKYPELRNAHDELKATQEMMLSEIGLGGKSIVFCMFLLKTQHGYIETEKKQLETPNGEPLTLIFTDSATFKRHKEAEAQLKAQ